MICRTASGRPDSTQIVSTIINPINFTQFLIRSSDGSWGRIVFSGETFVQNTLVGISTPAVLHPTHYCIPNALYFRKLLQ